MGKILPINESLKILDKKPCILFLPIQKIEGIKSAIEMIAKNFSRSVKGFEKTLTLEIEPVNSKIIILREVCEIYLARYQKILSSQLIFS